MTAAAAFVIPLALLFCRIGGCLMTAPGFSSTRLPVRIRLMAAIAVTLALAPALIERTAAAAAGRSEAGVVMLILGETLIGATIGLVGRILFAALETLLAAGAMAAGFGNVFGASLDEGEQTPQMAALLMAAATALFFVTGLHADVVVAIARSYDALPPGDALAPRAGLIAIADALARAFPLALQATSPLILYGLVVNVAIGLVNRLTPQIPVFFASTPFVIAGALALIYATGATLLLVFMDGVRQWAAGVFP